MRRGLLQSSYSFKRLNADVVPASERLGQYYYFIRKRASDLHFSTYYSRNLRDHLLNSKPTKSFVFRDIYAPTNELEHLSKFSQEFLGYSRSPYEVESLSRRRPYARKPAISRRPDVRGFLANDRSEKFRKIRKHYKKIGQLQSTTYLEFVVPLLAARHTLLGPQTHTPTRLVLSKKERAEFLAAARSIRSIRNYNRLNRLKQQFSNFHLYKQIIPSNHYPRDAINLFLAFEAFRMPQAIARDGASAGVVDPYYRYANSGFMPSAYGPGPTKTFSSAVGYNSSSNRLAYLKEYDPVHVYDLPKNYMFYTFLPSAYNSTLRFSNVFDNEDIYSGDLRELQFFNRSAQLNSEFLREISDYEDYLDDYLNRGADQNFYFDSSTGEPEMFSQFAYSAKYYLSLDSYERLPVKYGPFNTRSYARVRSARRYLGRRDRFMVGDYRKPGIPRFILRRQHPHRFGVFADHLAAISDYSRVKSLDSVYFSDFKAIARRSRASLIADVAGSKFQFLTPRRRLKTLSSYYGDPAHYRGRADIPPLGPSDRSSYKKHGLSLAGRSSLRNHRGPAKLPFARKKSQAVLPKGHQSSRNSKTLNSKKLAGTTASLEQNLRGGFRPTYVSDRLSGVLVMVDENMINQRRLAQQSNLLIARERRRQKSKMARERSGADQSQK